MKNIFLIIWLFFTIPLMAQQIIVEDFHKVEKIKGQDKQTAILDLYTNEDSFTFQIGENPVVSKQEEGFFRILMPNKSNHLLIKHPQYGQFNWKIPGKGLKKKKHYQAYLKTESIDKEFKLSKQWLVLSIRPRHAIIYLDSTMHAVQNGLLSVFLPIGKHTCKIVSPFHQELTDTIEITDSAKVERTYVLDTFYAFLTVETNDAQSEIFLDNKRIGQQKAHTGRIKPGNYHLVIKKEGLVCYDKWIQVAKAENKVINFAKNELCPLPQIWTKQISDSQQPIENISDSTSISTIAQPGRNYSLVNINAIDDSTEIWINREMKAEGTWQGELSAGFYAISTKKRDLDSRTSYFWVDPGKDMEMNLKSPLADYGMLNIASNVINAIIYLNGVEVGRTPCVIKDLPAYRNYKIQLVKGNNKAEKIITLKPNDIININMKLKTK